MGCSAFFPSLSFPVLWQRGSVKFPSHIFITRQPFTLSAKQLWFAKRNHQYLLLYFVTSLLLDLHSIFICKNIQSQLFTEKKILFSWHIFVSRISTDNTIHISSVYISIIFFSFTSLLNFYSSMHTRTTHINTNYITYISRKLCFYHRFYELSAIKSWIIDSPGHEFFHVQKFSFFCIFCIPWKSHSKNPILRIVHKSKF